MLFLPGSAIILSCFMTFSKETRLLRWKDFRQRLCAPSAAFLLARVRLPQTEYPSLGFHRHDFAELFWVVDGQGWYERERDRLPLTLGQAYFIRPEHAHAIVPKESSNLHLINLAFPEKELRLIQQLFEDIGELFWPCGSEPRSFVLSRSTLGWMEAETRLLAAGGHDRVALFRFLLGLYEHLRPNPTCPIPATAPVWLHKAYEQFCQPDNLGGGVARFAKLAGRRPETLSRVIRRVTGRRSVDLVNQCRMEYAARELRMTDRTILDILMECGFAGTSQFYTRFKNFFAMSPGEYRRQFSKVA